MNKEDLTKLYLSMQTDIKVHARKGKNLVASNAKNIFQILRKIQNLLFIVKISFMPLLLQLPISSTILRCNGGSSSYTATL